MLSSSEISSMFAAQQQMFADQQQYSRQLMSSNMGTLADWGTPQQQRTQPQGMPGMRPPPPPISYAPSGFSSSSYGGGTKFAGTAMSAAGGMASLGGAALGMGAMASPMLGRMFDPISGFAGGMGGGVGKFMGMGSGGMMGGGIMGGLAGMAAPLAIAYGASKFGSAFMQGGQQQQMINTQLGNNFNFINNQSRTGQGFSRDDAQAIGSQIRQLANIPEMMTSVSELTKMLPKMKSMGIMQGVKDASEFASRFKETVKTIRDMSKVLGTTMEEATEFFRHSRSVGFLGKKDQLQNVLNSQFTAGYTGMSVEQTMGMQQTGAAMARSVGGQGRMGATGVANIAQRLQYAMRTGKLSEETLSNVSNGKEGAEGIQAASERMYGLMLNLGNTASGRLIMAGAMKRDSKGQVTLDQGIIDKVNSGEMNVDELKRRASSLSREDKISYTKSAGGRLGAQFAGQVDFGSFMQGLVGKKGKDAAALTLMNQGIGANEQDVDMLMGLGSGPSSGEKRSFASKRMVESQINERTDPTKIWDRLKTKMYTGSGLAATSEMGSKAFSYLGKEFDNFLDDVVGRHIITLSAQGEKTLAAAFGSQRGRDEMKKIFQRQTGIKEPAPGAGLIPRPGLINLGGSASAGGPNIFTKLVELSNEGQSTGRSAEREWAVTKERFGENAVSNLAKMEGQGSEGTKRGVGKVVGGLMGSGFGDMTDARKMDVLSNELASKMATALGGTGLDREHTKSLLLGGGGAKKGEAKWWEQEGGLAGLEKKFGGADALAAKIEEMKAAGGDTADLGQALSAGVAAVKRGDANGIAHAVAALGAGGKGKRDLIDTSKLGSKEASDFHKRIKTLDKDMREASSQLDEKVDKITASLVRSNPGARELLVKAIAPDGELSPSDKIKKDAIRDALNLEDPDAVFQALHKIDPGIREEDVSALQAAYEQAERGDTEKGKDYYKAISKFSGLEQDKDRQAMEIAVEKASNAKGLDEGLSKALKGWVKGDGAEGIDKAIGALVQQAKSGPEGKAKALASAGQFSSAVAKGLELEGQSKKKWTAAELTQSTGMSFEELQKEGILSGSGITEKGGSGALTGEAFGKLKKAVMGGEVGSSLVRSGAGAIHAQDKDQAVLSALQKLDATIERNSTVIQNLNKKDTPSEKAAGGKAVTTGTKTPYNGPVQLHADSQRANKS